MATNVAPVIHKRFFASIDVNSMEHRPALTRQTFNWWLPAGCRVIAHIDARDATTLCLKLRDERTSCGHRDSVAIDLSRPFAGDFSAMQTSPPSGRDGFILRLWH
jgi:hypothetical protein